MEGLRAGTVSSAAVDSGGRAAVRPRCRAVVFPDREGTGSVTLLLGPGDPGYVEVRVRIQDLGDPGVRLEVDLGPVVDGALIAVAGALSLAVGGVLGEPLVVPFTNRMTVAVGPTDPADRSVLSFGVVLSAAGAGFALGWEAFEPFDLDADDAVYTSRALTAAAARSLESWSPMDAQ